MINAITYVDPKNKTMAHIMSLNNIIYYVVGISIPGFDRYWHTVFYSMDLNISPTFKNSYGPKNSTPRKLIPPTL